MLLQPTPPEHPPLELPSPCTTFLQYMQTEQTLTQQLKQIITSDTNTTKISAVPEQTQHSGAHHRPRTAPSSAPAPGTHQQRLPRAGSSAAAARERCHWRPLLLMGNPCPGVRRCETICTVMTRRMVGIVMVPPLKNL